MAEVSGTNIVLKNQSVQVEDLTANSMSIDKTIIDVTNKSSNGWREKISGVKNWTMSATAMFDPAATEGLQQIFDDFTNDPAVTVSMGPPTPVAGDIVYSGTAIVASIEKTADFDAAAEYSFTLEGTGELTQTVTP